MESELKQTTRFVRSEIAHWKRAYDSNVQRCQTKIYLIELM